MQIQSKYVESVRVLIDKPLDQVVLEDVRAIRKKVKFPCKLDFSVFYQSCRAARASSLTFSKCLHLVDLNNPRTLMMHDKMAVTANIRA